MNPLLERDDEHHLHLIEDEVERDEVKGDEEKEEEEKPFKWAACTPDVSKGIKVTTERARRLAKMGEQVHPNPGCYPPLRK